MIRQRRSFKLASDPFSTAHGMLVSRVLRNSPFVNRGDENGNRLTLAPYGDNGLFRPPLGSSVLAPLSVVLCLAVGNLAEITGGARVWQQTAACWLSSGRIVTDHSRGQYYCTCIHEHCQRA